MMPLEDRDHDPVQTSDPPFQGNLTILWATEKQALLERMQQLETRMLLLEQAQRAMTTQGV